MVLARAFGSRGQNRRARIFVRFASLKLRPCYNYRLIVKCVGSLTVPPRRYRWNPVVGFDCRPDVISDPRIYLYPLAKTRGRKRGMEIRITVDRDNQRRPTEQRTALDRLAGVARGFRPTEDPEAMLSEGRAAMWNWIQVAEALGAVHVDYGGTLEYEAAQEIIAMSPALSAAKAAREAKDRAKPRGGDAFAALFERWAHLAVEAREARDATPDDVADGW